MGNAYSSSNTLFDGFPRVEPSEYETSKDKRDRTLKHLLRANHQNHAVLYHDKIFHNHTPHVLGSAYLFGATSEQLQEFYDDESKTLEEWKDAPGEISRHDWRSFIGKREYQRAFVDFFEDEMVRLGYNWKQVVAHYMLEGEHPLITGAIGGLGHPLIHLGYAFEFNSREVAMEALALAATNYNFLHKYIDDDAAGGDSLEVVPENHGDDSAYSLVSKLRNDKRLDGLFTQPGADNIGELFQKKEDVVLEYFRSYPISDITAAHRELNKLSTILLCAVPEYDFFICHLLTTSYAVRTVLPELPVKHALPLVKAQWLFIVLVYCIQLRPDIKPQLIDDVDVRGKTWEDVKKNALVHCPPGDAVADTHYLKALRTMEQSAKLWPDEETFYLKAAVKLGWEFAGWGGFAR